MNAVRVYPRLRGGSLGASQQLLYAYGLSPPTRGIPRTPARTTARRGSIPAYAGDPETILWTTFGKRVYPRLRGGSPIQPRKAEQGTGLSPPTRGILAGSAREDVVKGSIPAYAGDPRIQNAVSSKTRVYPRLRGGSPRTTDYYQYSEGLSPPTRGILERRVRPLQLDGSIPAYAGDPTSRVRRCT